MTDVEIELRAEVMRLQKKVEDTQAALQKVHDFFDSHGWSPEQLREVADLDDNVIMPNLP
jgi:hypothetical protein